MHENRAHCGFQKFLSWLLIFLSSWDVGYTQDLVCYLKWHFQNMRSERRSAKKSNFSHNFILSFHMTWMLVLKRVKMFNLVVCVLKSLMGINSRRHCVCWSREFQIYVFYPYRARHEPRDARIDYKRMITIFFALFSPTNVDKVKPSLFLKLRVGPEHKFICLATNSFLLTNDIHVMLLN